MNISGQYYCGIPLLETTEDEPAIAADEDGLPVLAIVIDEPSVAVRRSKEIGARM